MPRNANGTFTLVSGNPVVTGTVIESDWANTTMPDLGVEISDSLSRSGKGGMLATFKAINGSNSAPSISFTNFLGQGLYSAEQGDVRMAVAQIDQMRWKNNVTQIWNVEDAEWFDVLTTRQTIVTVEQNATLVDGQLIVIFADDIGGAEFFINGTNADNGRLILGVDFTLVAATKTVTLTNSYPAGTILTAIIGSASNLTPLTLEGSVRNYQDLDSALADVNLLDTMSCEVQEHTVGNSGGGKWNAVPVVSVVPNDFDIRQCTGVPELALVLEVKDVLNIRQIGAVELTDVALAVNHALGKYPCVYAPSGDWVTSVTLDMKSNQVFYGDGIDLTNFTWDRATSPDHFNNTIRMLGVEGTPIENCTFKGMTVDSAKDGSPVGGGGGPRGTGVSVQHGVNILIEDVFSKNAPLHCFDVSSLAWNTSDNQGAQDGGTGSTTVMIDVSGGHEWIVNSFVGALIINTTDGSEGRIISNTADSITSVALAGGVNDFWSNGDTFFISNETQQANRSSDVTLRRIKAEAGGDDNITCHYSDNIKMSEITSLNPSGTHTGNSNCIEVDDGCTKVSIRAAYLFGGTRGIEVKGHGYAPAAANVNIDDVIIENCVRGIQVRHIGHNTGSDPISTTAFGVNMNNIQIINPAPANANADAGGLLIHTYEGVNANNVEIINNTGDPSNLLATDNVVGIDLRAGKVNMTNVNVQGFATARAGLSIGNAANKNTSFIKVSNFHVDGASEACYKLDGNIEFISLDGLSGQNAPIGLLASKGTFKTYPVEMNRLFFDDTVTVEMELNFDATTTRSYNRRLEVDSLLFGSTNPVTIDGGAITSGIGSSIRVATEGGGNDNLDNIIPDDSNNGHRGMLLIIRAADTGDTVTVRDGVGNIQLANGADMVLNTQNKTLTLIFDDPQNEWLEISRAE